ncbi:MAG: hypothetical protein HKN03_12515 [Acidimicrobiales bacterium]|nr:hypothetical protein [Acidimicrobiales bacterium]
MEIDELRSSEQSSGAHLSVLARALIIVGSLLCAAIFFGALFAAFLAYADNQESSSPVQTPPAIESDQFRCDPDVIGEQDGPVVAVYEVNDSALGSLCFGRANPAVIGAWEALEVVAPSPFLEPVVSLAGYDFDGPVDTMAFAGPIDFRGLDFTVALEVDAAVADPEELRLTMMHELAHVFSQDSSQFFADVARDDCETFHNGFGCFAEESYVNLWVTRFWDQAAIDALPDDGSPDQDAGDERCLNDSAFPGSYGASHPEEDFAESFAAFVYGVEMLPDVQPRLDFFAEFPELAEFRSNARKAGLSNLPNNYDDCG